MSDSLSIGAKCWWDGCPIRPNNPRYVHTQTSFMCCSSHSGQLGESEKVVERFQKCDQCDKLKLAISLNLTRTQGMVCEVCFRQIPKEGKYNLTELPSHPLTAHMDNLLTPFGLVSKIICIQNNFSSTGKLVAGYARVTIAVFNNDVLAMVLIVDLHYDDFTSYYSGIFKRTANQRTAQLAYVDSLSLRTELKIKVLESLFKTVRDLFWIKSIHLFSMPPSVGQDYLIHGGYDNRLFGREHQLRTEEEAKTSLRKFYWNLGEFCRNSGIAKKLSNMKEVIEAQPSGDMSNIPMHIDDSLFSQASNGRPYCKFFRITTKKCLFGDMNEEKVLSNLKKESVVIELTDPDPTIERISLPKEKDLNGLFMLDKDRLFNQSIYNQTGFHTPDSARQSTQILLKYLFEGIYQIFRCSKCRRFILTGVERKENQKLCDIVPVCVACRSLKRGIEEPATPDRPSKQMKKDVFNSPVSVSNVLVIDLTGE